MAIGSSGGLGHQCEEVRCDLQVLSVEYRMMCPRKDRRAKVLVYMEAGLLWRRNTIRPDTPKGWLLRIKSHFRWYFVIVRIEVIVNFPQQSSLSVTKREGEC